MIIVVALLAGMPVAVLGDKVRPGVGRAVALWSFRFVSRLCRVRFEVSGLDQLRAGERYIFVANHSSPLDVPAMFLFQPSARYMAAAGLLRVPLLGAAIRVMGGFPIDRNDRATARRQLAVLAREPWHSDVVIFPEGDIAPKGVRLPFKMGAFALAIETHAAVVPVAIHHTADLLPRSGRLRVRSGLVRTEFLAPIATAHLRESDCSALRDQAREAVVGALGHDQLTTEK